MTTVNNEIQDTKMQRPHVVILGAGASLAAFPNGDRYGKKLPLINNLSEILEIDDLLEKYSIDPGGKDFEELYSDLVSAGKQNEAIKEIDRRVQDYFVNLSLPEPPTLYDHLILSLRPKDYIATFNWDPFLFRSCARLYGRVPLPKILFLHGNVAVGYCETDKMKGAIGSRCGKCGKFYAESRLLFPVKQKDYNSDPFIRAEWDTLKHRLKSAYMVTVFGYSAPKTDVEAIALLKEGWGANRDRDLEQIEVIDIKSEDDLLKTWDEFIHTHHCQFADNFYDSWIANHPRRTCEAMWNQLMECQFLDKNSIPRALDLNELLKWYEPLLQAERQNAKEQ
jgi:hypothetical protein